MTCVFDVIPRRYVQYFSTFATTVSARTTPKMHKDPA